MYNIAICGTFFLEMLISYSFFSQIGDKKYKNWYCLLIGLVLFESGSLVDILFSNIVCLNTVYFALINIAFGLLCFKIKATKTIFYSILLDIFSTALEFASIFLISIFTHTDVTAYVDKTAFFILDVVISKLLYFLTCLLLARFLNSDDNNIHFPLGFYFYPAVVVGSLLVFWSICANSSITDSQQIALSIVSAALFFSIIILFIFYQNSVEKENQYIILQKEYEKIQTDNNYYDILEKQNEDLMIYAHDAKKHLMAISELNDNNEISQYITTMTNQLNTYSQTCHSGNHTFDVIINKYVTECKIKDVSFSFDVRLANFKYVNSHDLVAILSNILDNALESAERSKEKVIDLTSNHVNTYDVLVVTNSCDIAPNESLKTTKDDKRAHGLGIKSVKKTLKVYDGDMEWEYDSKRKIFKTIVIILNK